MDAREALCRSVVASVLDNLDEKTRVFVLKRITWEFRAKPNQRDLNRGAEEDFEAYFFGHRVRSEDDEEEGDELFEVEGSDVAAHPHHEPGGIIVIFWGNIEPLFAENVEQTVLHEIGHFLGDEEADLEEAGIG